MCSSNSSFVAFSLFEVNNTGLHSVLLFFSSAYLPFVVLGDQYSQDLNVPFPH